MEGSQIVRFVEVAHASRPMFGSCRGTAGQSLYHPPLESRAINRIVRISIYIDTVILVAIILFGSNIQEVLMASLYPEIYRIIRLMFFEPRTNSRSGRLPGFAHFRPF